MSQTKSFDVITKAHHYNTGKFEPIDIMLDCKMGGCLFTVVKYISRAGKKPDNEYLKDIKKARYYLEKEISQQCLGHEEFDVTRKCSLATPQQLAIDWGLNSALGFTLTEIMTTFGLTVCTNKLDHLRTALMYLSDEIEREEINQTPINRNYESILRDQQ